MRKKRFKTVPVRVHCRKIDRMVARNNLAKQGNLHRAIKSGHFAQNWRKYADAQTI